MEVWVYVLALLLCSSGGSSDVVLTVPTGDDVTLNCSTSDDLGDLRGVVLEWTRDEQNSPYVLLFRDGKVDPSGQDPYFENRVELVNPGLNGGELSVVLKNAQHNDSGEYECRFSRSSTRKRRLDSDRPTARQRVRLKVKEVRQVVRGPGEDCELTCVGPAEGEVMVLEWKRDGLDPDEYVLLFRDGHEFEDHQDPSYRHRVRLRDPQMRNGDASVILDSVRLNDTGKYECVSLYKTPDGPEGVKHVYNLTVTKEDFTKKGGDPHNSLGLGLGVSGALIFVGLCVLAAVWVVRSKRSCNNPPQGTAQEQVQLSPPVSQIQAPPPLSPGLQG